MSRRLRRTRRSYACSLRRCLSPESLESRDLLTTFMVDALGDVDDGIHTLGNLTLREAVGLANTMGGDDEITFDASLSADTIILAGTELQITDAVTIDASSLTSPVTIDATGQSRVINISALGGDFTLRGLTLTDGVSIENGGAVRISNGSLLVEDSTVSGSSAIGWGGGIYAGSAADLAVSRSTIDGNSSRRGGGLLGNRAITVSESTISNNTVVMGGGGGIYGDDTIVVRVIVKCCVLSI